LRNDFGKVGSFRFGTLVTEQLPDRLLNFSRWVPGLSDPYRKAQPFLTPQIRDLLYLHADTDDGFASKCRGHDGSISTMDDRQIRHPTDLQHWDPVGHENIGQNMYVWNLGKLEFHRSDHAVRFSLEALDDVSDDLGCAPASHRKVDERPVPGNVPDLVGQRKLARGNKRTREEMVGRQVYARESWGLGDQRDIAPQKSNIEL